MKAAVIDKYGGVDELKIRDVPMPELGNRDLLIEVYAASVNPVDWKVREGYLRERIHHTFPLILGWDVAGVVKETGPGATLFSPGDHVFSRTDIERNGTYAEYVAVDEELVAMMPENLSFREGAAVPLACQTAWQALVETVSVQACDRVLVHAGSGGVGTFAIQIAKNRGAHVAATCSSTNTELVKSLGADEVIDYGKTDFSAVLRDFDIVLDTMGGEIYRKSFKILKKGGIVISLLERPDEALEKESEARAAYVFMQPDRKRLGLIAELLQGRDIKAVIGTVLPLDEVKKAHALSQTHHAKGKIVLAVKESDTGNS
jgi:NADPH:quinone reductase-like Zn-dependent oxidoreductase